MTDVDEDAYWANIYLADAGSDGSTGPVGLVGGSDVGSTGLDGPVGSLEGSSQTGSVLDDVRSWLDRFICTVDETDIDLLVLWAAHTHLVMDLYTSPRLILDSSVPGSGKTTVLEHLERLCQNPVQMASLSSPALLTRMLDAGMRTVLIDEADRSLDPKKEGVGELIAVLNSGYKRGGTRPVLVPSKKNGWDVKEMPTYSPVVMAGNNPNLPEDTRSRSIRVLLMPDIDGTAEESDWELLDDQARDLGKRLGFWADCVRDEIRSSRPPLPDGVNGRARERWLPLLRVGKAGGDRWTHIVEELAVKDVRRLAAEREEGIVQERPAVLLLRHIHEVWRGEHFLTTDDLIERLTAAHPEAWGAFSPFGKTLTPQRMGRMLVTAYNIHSDRLDGRRGYLLVSLSTAFRRFGLTLSDKPTGPVEPSEPAGVVTFDTAGPAMDNPADPGSPSDKVRLPAVTVAALS